MGSIPDRAAAADLTMVAGPGIHDDRVADGDVLDVRSTQSTMPANS